MNCIEARRLLHAYIDAELDAENSLDVEEHLRNCQSCARDYNHYLALRTAIREGSLYFSTPELLRRRIQSSVRRIDQSPSIARRISWRSLSVAAALLFALFGVWGLFQWWAATSSTVNAQAEEVLDSHIRSLLSNHLVDITSSDQSTVKPWFTGKLGFSPPVINLDTQGYSMLGGRLDYLDSHMTAAVVYKCGSHVINLFFWPATRQEEEAAVKTTTMRGYNLTHWTAYGMNCWAVSDLETDKLHQFVQLIQQNTDQADARFSKFQRAFWSGGT